jgi:ribose-phosphate pyrophosphokinase
MKIIPGPASRDLGEKIAAFLNAETVPLAFRLHPDGESYVRLEGKVQGEDVVIVQTTCPPQDSRLVQLALIADAAKRYGAKKVAAVVPYLAYARQDRAFLEGEAVGVEVIAQLLKAAGIDSLLTVNVHQAKALAKFPFPSKTISAIHLLADYFKKKGLEKAFALAPDSGALWLVEEAQTVLGGECGFFEKHRDRYTGQTSTEKKKLDIEGKVVIIFDDIISTGGTIVSAAKVAKELGATEVYMACVHPLLIGDAERRIREAGVVELVGTDSVPSNVGRISLAPLLGSELRQGV